MFQLLASTVIINCIHYFNLSPRCTPQLVDHVRLRFLHLNTLLCFLISCFFIPLLCDHSGQGVKATMTKDSKVLNLVMWLETWHEFLHLEQLFN